jgi:hypothetical protein
MDTQPARDPFAYILADTTRCTPMTLVSTRPVLRLLLVVAMLLLASSLRGCQPLMPSTTSTSDIGRRPPGFTEAYPYSDGIDVQISDVWIGRRLGVPVIEFTVIIRNGTPHSIETWIRGDLRYGPHRLPALRYVTPPGPDDHGSVQLIATGASSDPYQLNFIVPPGSRDDLTFDIAFDAGGHDPAVFVGGR